MKKKWIALYFILLFIPFIVVLILGKTGYFDPQTTPEDPPGYTVALYRHQTESIQQLPLKEYLWGVLAGEMPASYPPEALKAQAVASYSYLLHRKQTLSEHPESDFGHPGDVCDNPNHCKAFLSPAEASLKWGKDWLKSSQTILQETVEAVLGKAVLHDGKPANTVFHAISGGKTEDAEDVWGAKVPYLIPVDSHWDESAKGFQSEVSIPLAEFRAVLGQSDCTPGAITLSRGGSVQTMVLGPKTFTGRELRSLFALRSTRFTLEIGKETALFKVSGYGHQVGMSQYGASILAQNGYSYRQILAYYYPGTTLSEYFFDE